MLDKTNLLTLYIYYIKNFNICQIFPWGKAIRSPPKARVRPMAKPNPNY